MKTLKKIILVSFIIGSIFTSVQLTQGNNALTNQTVFGLGDKISAGPDAVIGLNPIFITQGSSSYSGFIIWTTSGDGVFENPYNVNSIYTPGEQDNILGHVTLTITLIPHGMHQSRLIADSMTLSLPF